MQSRVDRQLRALAVAKACAAHGARVRTIHHLTGLLPREILHLLFPDRQAVPKGRSPDSPEWYYHANLLDRADASLVVALYLRMRWGGFAGAEALLGSYGHYAGDTVLPCRISFDRAFDLAAHVEGRWLADSPSFSLITCPVCDSAHLAAYGSIERSNRTCPFCRLIKRHKTDPRLRQAFPVRPLVVADPGQLGLLELLRGEKSDPGPRLAELG